MRLCELNEEEFDAIAQHQRLPTIIAIEAAEKIMSEQDGESKVRQMIEGDLVLTDRTTHYDQATHWEHVLQHFNKTYPPQTI